MKNKGKIFLSLLMIVLIGSIVLMGCPSPTDSKPDPKPIQKFTISFDSDGGSEVPDQEVESGKKVAKPDDPEKEGWHFGGWLNSEGEGYDFNQAVTTDLILKANWQVIVTFNANGGTLKYSTATTKEAYFDKGEGFAAPELTRTAEGKTFNLLGWSEKIDATEESFETDSFDLSSGSETSPIELFAVWTEKNVYTVSFDTNDGRGTFNPISVIEGEKCLEPSAKPTLTSHYFRFWSKDGSTAYNFDTSVTESFSLKALWVPEISLLSAITNGSLVVYCKSSSPKVSENWITATYTTTSNPSPQPLELTYESQSTFYITYSFTEFEPIECETYTISITNGEETKSRDLRVVVPAPVTDLVATVKDSQVDLSWTKPEGYSSVDIKCEDGNTVVFEKTTAATSITLFGLENGKEYTFTVTTTGTDKFDTIKAKPTITKKTSDWLFLLYADGDNNLNDVIFLDLNEVEYGLYQIRNTDGSPKEDFASVNVVALWDGFAGDSSTTPQIGKSGTFIYEMGTDSSNVTTYTTSPGCVLSSTTKNLSYTADWVVPRSDVSEITPSSFGEVNMGDKDTLVNFLKWAQDRYEAENIVLQFSNHGGGPRNAPVTVVLEDGRLTTLNNNSGRRALCWDENSPDSFLKTKDVSDAFAEAGYDSSNKLGMILMDVCLGSSIEDAYQFRNYANYLAASPNNIPGMGMDYVAMMKACKSDATLESFGNQMVKDYKSFYKFTLTEWNSIITDVGLPGGLTQENLSKVMWLSDLGIPTFTITDLNKMNDVKTAIDALARLLLANKTKILYYDTVVKGFVASPNENTDEVPYLEVLKDYARFGGFSGNSIYYIGTFSWLFDIGYIAENMRFVSAETMGGNQNVLAWPELNTASTILIDELDAAIVSSWRDAPTQDSNLYPVINPDKNPFGLMICGETIHNNGGTIMPGTIPSFYKTDLAFGHESSWADLLTEWFGE